MDKCGGVEGISYVKNFADYVSRFVETVDYEGVLDNFVDISKAQPLSVLQFELDKKRFGLGFDVVRDLYDNIGRLGSLNVLGVADYILKNLSASESDISRLVHIINSLKSDCAFPFVFRHYFVNNVLPHTQISMVEPVAKSFAASHKSCSRCKFDDEAEKFLRVSESMPYPFSSMMNTLIGTYHPHLERLVSISKKIKDARRLKKE